MPQTFEFRNLASLNAAMPAGWKWKDIAPTFMDSLLLANGMPRDGVIHLGANQGQEVWLYTQLGFRRALMVEPLPGEFALLSQRCAQAAAYTRAEHETIGAGARPPIEFHCVECAVADRSGTSTFYRTSASVASSLSRPVIQPANGRYETDEIQVDVRTLDELMGMLPGGWSVDDFTYLRMNIQNSELLALRGGAEVLRTVQGVFLEVNLVPRYENQPVKDDFDELFGAFGFECTFGMSHGGTVGNLFYRRG